MGIPRVSYSGLWYYTAFIQTTATLGLLLSLLVIISVQGYVNGNYPDQPVLDAVGAAVMNADGTPQMMKAFNAWGWRVPFLGSLILLLVSMYIRLQMNESPAFKKMKDEGHASKAPQREAFGTWKNGKIALIALFGLTAGQAVVWYSGQFYALFFMQNVIKVDSFSANVFVAWSLVLGTAGFLYFGSLSDRIGRKPIILAGCLIAAITYFPVFGLLTKAANPMLAAAQQTPVIVTADPADCSFQFNPVGTAKFTNSCDIVKAKLYSFSVNSQTAAAPAGSPATITIGDTVIPAYDAGQNTSAIATTKAAVADVKATLDTAQVTALEAAQKAVADAKTAIMNADKAAKAADGGTDDAAKTTAKAILDAANAALPAAQTGLDTARAAVPSDALAKLDAASDEAAKANGIKGSFDKAVADALTTAGYPLVAKDNVTVAKAENIVDIFTTQKLTIIAILTYLIVLVTMVYGPIAAMLVELFPTRIRYSGMSLPYHIGNGWFGGLLPATDFAISAQSGNIYAGLWYAIIVALVTVVVGAIFVPGDTHKKSIFADDANR